MLSKVTFFLAVLYVQCVYSSYHHGPTALPHVLHDGYLADTPEVAAAKSAHLATLSHQSHGGNYGSHGYHGDVKYQGPTALPHVLHDGHIADTHEVSAAKAEHFAAVADARAHGGYHHGSEFSSQSSSEYDHQSGVSGAHHGSDGHTSHHGPIAIPHVLHDGHIADTHEVAAAKAEHYAAVAKARAHGGYHHEGDYSSQSASGYNHHSAAHHTSGVHTSYHGHTANTVVLASGYLADTDEVAHAKQHHLQALNQAIHHDVGTHRY